MRIGIVGSEAAKFTPETELQARAAINGIIDSFRPAVIVSGACHLGGIDIWAVEEGRRNRLDCIEHHPSNLRWSDGYRPRNIKIAEDSDLLVCITVKELPPDYKGMRFKLCYHCGTDTHVKSGGCWTMKYAKKLGKKTQLIVI